MSKPNQSPIGGFVVGWLLAPLFMPILFVAAIMVVGGNNWYVHMIAMTAPPHWYLWPVWAAACGTEYILVGFGWPAAAPIRIDVFELPGLPILVLIAGARLMVCLVFMRILIEAIWCFVAAGWQAARWFVKRVESKHGYL